MTARRYCRAERELVIYDADELSLRDLTFTDPDAARRGVAENEAEIVRRRAASSPAPPAGPRVLMDGVELSETDSAVIVVALENDVPLADIRPRLPAVTGCLP